MFPILYTPGAAERFPASRHNVRAFFIISGFPPQCNRLFQIFRFRFPPRRSVSAGREVAPGLDAVEQAVRDRASSAWFLPCRSMGIELGSAQCGNNILLGALCVSGLLPFGFEALEEGIRTFMPAKLVDVNLKAAERGREILASSRLF